MPASEAACEYVHKDSQLAAQSVEVELYIRSRIRWTEIKLAYTLVTPWCISWSRKREKVKPRLKWRMVSYLTDGMHVSEI